MANGRYSGQTWSLQITVTVDGTVTMPAMPNGYTKVLMCALPELNRSGKPRKVLTNSGSTKADLMGVF